MFDAFAADERAIEGLPIRLVIAFIVGMASLSVMLNMVSGLGGLAVSELDVRPTPDVVRPGEQSVAIRAVDANGDSVGGSTVVVRSGSATVDGPIAAETNDTGVATVELAPSLAPGQADGTLRVDVKPPAGTSYADDRKNTEILVLKEG